MLTQKYYAAVVDSNNNYEIHWGHFKNADAAREDIEYSKNSMKNLMLILLKDAATR